MRDYLPYLWFLMPLFFGTVATLLTIRQLRRKVRELASPMDPGAPGAVEDPPTTPPSPPATVTSPAADAAPVAQADPGGFQAPGGLPGDALSNARQQAADCYAARCAPCPASEAFGRLLTVQQRLDLSLSQQRVPNVLLAMSAPVTDVAEGAMLPFCDVQGDVTEVATLLGYLLLNVSQRPSGDAIVQEALRWLNGQRSDQIKRSGLTTESVAKDISRAN